jgi:hypothetical protein
MEKNVSAPKVTQSEPRGEDTSSVASHRRGERIRTYVPHPRPEARM